MSKKSRFDYQHSSRFVSSQKCSELLWRSTFFGPNYTWLLSSRLKRPELKNCHTHPPLAGVKNAWSCYTTATKCLLYVVLNIVTVVICLSNCFLVLSSNLTIRLCNLFLSVSTEAVCRIMGKCFMRLNYCVLPEVYRSARYSGDRYLYTRLCLFWKYSTLS